MNTVTLGFAMCGSFCTFKPVLAQLAALREAYPEIIPLMSAASVDTVTRVGAAEDFRARLQEICGHEILHTLPQVEPLGPKELLDLLIVCPCTGNTLAKLAAGVADTPVTLAVKAHLRNERPVVIAVSSNDSLAANAANIGALLSRKHYYFVPFRQDAPAKKPRSMVADFTRLHETVDYALRGQQLQPIVF